MEKVVLQILDELRKPGAPEALDAKSLDRIVRQRSSEAHDGRRVFAKKHILPFYLAEREKGSEAWHAWNVDDRLHECFVKTLQMKPRRTASGVATITVITKPWPCGNDCIYCPNDPNMPKSYLSDEPACQRAARNRFHPYLQVASRLNTLEQMGHATDKVELIVLGGTWFDYPFNYRAWFVEELFRALNDTPQSRLSMIENPTAVHDFTSESYDGADIENQQRINEHAAHRVVGLVMETRPDTVSAETLKELRSLGCTKVQLGVQSVRDDLLRLNGRNETADTIRNAFELCRLFGFKIHAHFMVNLLGATPQSDVDDFHAFSYDRRFQPDEVKLYPCALVGGTQLVEHYEDGSWLPYSESELVDVLSRILLDTPPFMRISRMIRDISSHDILAGNKKTNLRQMVEENIRNRADEVQEIRFREIATESPRPEELSLEEVSYPTTCSEERFLQWVTHDNRIAGFLRLSLPAPDALARYDHAIPIQRAEAMIREVHVYGFATQIDADGTAAQHRGLGRALVDRACAIARNAGYERINVISAVGTRDYYRKLGFEDNGLYQRKKL